MQKVNIKAAIGFYENRFNSATTIYLVNRKPVDSLEDALLHKDQYG